MSGSNSSARSEGPDALSFTVHSMPAPEASMRRRRIVGGRWRLLLLLVACAAPVVASYFAYYVVRPEGRTNYSDLILPTRTLPADLGLTDLAGTPVDPASLRGQWLTLLVFDADCDAACEERVLLQRQLREMLGRERDRVDRVWLVTGAAAPSLALQQAAAATGPLTVLRADAGAVARWLSPAAGQALHDHLYIVDPMGEWMMRAPAEPAPQRLKRDLERLLRASSSWDRAGRGT
jgi:hypothetical protein